MIRTGFVMLLSIFALSGCSTVESSANVRPSAERTIAAPIEVVYSEAVGSLMALGWQVTTANKSEHVIQARTPATIWTWGDLVTVYAVQTTPTTVRVDVTSASAQQYDWGKNRENIEKFYQRLQDAVESRGKLK